MIDSLSGLTEADSLIFKLSCEKAIKIGSLRVNNENILELLEQVKSSNISKDEFFEALEILNNRGYIEIIRTLSRGNISKFSITFLGFDEYAKVYIDYESILKSVASRIVNFNEMNNLSISTSLNQPQIIVDHIFNVLKSDGLIEVSITMRGREHMHIFDASKLKDKLK